jgi:hypothetical protein
LVFANHPHRERNPQQASHGDPLRAGVGFNFHDGRLQQQTLRVREVEKNLKKLFPRTASRF